MEEKYKQFVENISDGCAILVDGVIVFANSRFGEIFGYHQDKIIGMPITELIMPNDIQTLTERYAQVIQGEESAPEQLEVVAIKGDGDNIVVEISAKVILYDNEPAFCIIARDITERRLAEEELSIFYNAVEGAADAIIITDMEGIILYVNPTTKETYGYGNDELLGKPAAFFNPYSETSRHIISAVKKSGQWSGEFNQIKKSGGTFPALVSLSQIKNAEGKPIAIMGTVRDISSRKRMEDDLLATQKYAQNLIDRSLDMIISVDSRRRIVEFNLAAQEAFGYTKEEVLGRYIDILYANPENALEASESARKFGRYTGEVINRRKNGETFISYLAASVLLNEEGEFIGVMGVSRDITERKKMEEEIKFNYETQSVLNKLLKTSLEDIPLEEILERSLSTVLSIFHSNSEGEGAIFLVEDEPDVLVRKAYITKDDSSRGICNRVPFGKCFCGRAAETKEILFSEHIEEKDQMVNKFPGPHSHYIIPVLSTGRVLGVISIYLKEGHIHSNREEEILGSIANLLSGIIKRKQSEVILRESEEKLSLIFESVPEGIIITDLDGKIIDINTGAIYMHGYDTKDELIGHNMYKLVSEREHTKGIKNIKKTLQTGSMGLIYHTSVKKDNSSFPSAINAVVVKNARGEPAGFIIIIVDATEPQKIQERLIMADRLSSLGEMVSGIAHELNNPLGAVLGLSQLMQSKDLPSDVIEDAALINKETARAVNIVKNLLSFARKKEMVRQPVQINSIIQSVLEIRTFEQKANNIQVIINLAPDLPPVRADASQLQQVFLNLVINAEYFMTDAHKKGNLIITTELNGNNVRASFADDGPGIAAKDLKTIFNPFFTTKDIGKGTGLGLSISHGIISEHGGRIFAVSEPSEGAVFIVELPVDRDDHRKS